MTATTSAPKRPNPGGRVLDRLATRVFGLPPATTAFTVARGVRVPMRDGVELAADLYQPTSNPVGTILVRGPYGRSALMALPMARIFAARGYNALFVSCRGTFESGGDFFPMVSEVDDGHDVVAWMRDQPWYTGSFATVGGSYLAYTQWALLTDPPARPGRGRDLHLAARLRRARVGDRRLPPRLPRLEPHGRAPGGGRLRAGFVPHGHRRASQRQGDGRAALGAGGADAPRGPGALVRRLGDPPRPGRSVLEARFDWATRSTGPRSRSC